MKKTPHSTPYGSLITTDVPFVMPEKLQYTVTKSRIFIPHIGHGILNHDDILREIADRMQLDDRFTLNLTSYTFINSFGYSTEISVNSHLLIKLQKPMQQSELVTSQNITIKTTAPYMLLVKFEYYITSQDLSLPDFVLDDSILQNRSTRVTPITLYPVYEAPKKMNKSNVNKRKRRKQKKTKNMQTQPIVNRPATKTVASTKTKGNVENTSQPININVQVRNKSKQTEQTKNPPESSVKQDVKPIWVPTNLPKPMSVAEREASIGERVLSDLKSYIHTLGDPHRPKLLDNLRLRYPKLNDVYKRKVADILEEANYRSDLLLH